MRTGRDASLLDEAANLRVPCLILTAASPVIRAMGACRCSEDDDDEDEEDEKVVAIEEKEDEEEEEEGEVISYVSDARTYFNFVKDNYAKITQPQA